MEYPPHLGTGSPPQQAQAQAQAQAQVAHPSFPSPPPPLSPLAPLSPIAPPSPHLHSGSIPSASNLPPWRSLFPPEINSPPPPPQPFVNDDFDVIEWHKHYQSCVRYFLDVSQHSGPVQAAAAFVNIRLPFQNPSHPVHSSAPPLGTVPLPASRSAQQAPLPQSPATPAAPFAAATSLLPYIRRLVVTGYDFPAVLHSFFGDTWVLGIGPLHETERVNFMFAAKSDSWLRVQQHYDMGDGQTVPFLHSLKRVTNAEIVKAEARWSEWLAMQDWMLGPRAPGVGGSGSAGLGAGSGSGRGR